MVATRLVVVLFTVRRSVMLASVATRDEKNPLVEVLLVELRLAIVDEENTGVSVSV